MLPMNPRTVLLLSVFGIMLSNVVRAQTAQDYFHELYKAGGLDRMADQYVCFDDSPELQTFFIYAESRLLKDYLIATGEFAKLPKSQQQTLNKEFLIVRTYYKGVPHPDELFYSRDGNTWATDPFTVHAEKGKMRLRLNITPETQRFQRKVEVLNSEMKVTYETSGYGRCEAISPEVVQTGH